MPFYEYQAKNPVESCGSCQNVFDVMQNIKEDSLKQCPQCNNPIERLVSLPAAIINKNRSLNQYNCVQGAKYWRDANGNRHRVTESDGHRKSAPLSVKKTRTDEQIAAMKKADAKKDKKRRNEESYGNFVKRIKKR